MTNPTVPVEEKIDLEKKEDVQTYKSTDDIKVPDMIIDQIIGQEEAVETVIKAAKQRRNVLLSRRTRYW